MPTLRLRKKKQDGSSGDPQKKEKLDPPPPQEPQQEQRPVLQIQQQRRVTRRQTAQQQLEGSLQVQPQPVLEKPHLNVSPATVQAISSKQPVVRLHRYRTVPDKPSAEAEASSPELVVAPETVTNINRQRRKKRQRKESPEGEEAAAVVAEEGDEREEQEDRRNILLPPKSLFPSAADNHIVQNQKLYELRTSIAGVFGLIFNQIQDHEEAVVPCYESVERVYEFFEASGVAAAWSDDSVKNFGIKYRGVCVNALYSFGAVVWKVSTGRGTSHNAYAERVSKFLEYCLMHLGWKVEKRKRDGLREWKDQRYYPACYHAIKLFYKYHSDACTTTRAAQLTILLKFLENASRTGNYDYIQLVWETVGKCVLIRVKDKSATCRLLSLKILSYFVVLEDANAACQKELKYYTRYDPYDEVRRAGTRILGEKTRIKLRFFFDQAFDKRESVRVEAYRAMGVEVLDDDDDDDDDEGDGDTVESPKDFKLVRDMKDLQSDKLCKAIVWGAMHSGGKCNEIVKSEILPKWLKHSCKSDLVKFLVNIDAYQHMKAVVKILDMLLTTKDQERFVESLDLTFVDKIKKNALERDYKPLCIESFVAWLGLCKASDVVQSIRGRVIPPAHEMLEIIEALHACVFSEHEEAKEKERNEDITPVFCLVIALEVAKRFVPFEEGTRRHLVRELEQILLDPLLDERVIVIQAINTLHSFVEESQFEDSMMSVLQEVFDAKAGFNRSRDSTHGSSRPGDSIHEGPFAHDSVECPVVPATTPPPPDLPPLKTAYELTQMRSELCNLAMQRLNLQKRKEELIANKQFIDAVPVNAEIMRVQGLEAELACALKENEDLVKRADELKKHENLRATSVSVHGRSVSGASSGCDSRSIELESGVVGSEDVAGGGIISTVEEGLVKGLLMVNAFLDLCPKMDAFVRTIYDGYVARFMSENDVNLKMSVMQFLARIGMIEKREMRKVLCFMFGVLLQDAEVELKNIAFQCIVDLVLCYEYSDFCMTQPETHEPDELHPYKADMSRYLRDLLPHNGTDYPACTPSIMEQLIVETLTKRFPPALETMSPTDRNITHMYKNVGLLKLIVRGRLRDPVAISKVLCLWVNQDFSGTPVLRDLEHVLKLYHTFKWWDCGDERAPAGIHEIEGEVTEETFTPSSMMRVLGIATAEGVVSLCQEPRLQGKEGDETIAKFISYFTGFLDINDQPLMRTLTSTILNPVLNNPTRSYNHTLAKSASKIPITSPVSAKSIVMLIGDILHRMREYPVTASVSILRKELCAFLAKLKRVFGDDIVVVTQPDGKELVVGVDMLESGDEEEENEDERVGQVASFNEHDED